MKTLIVYKSRHGSTEKIATYLKEKIQGAEMRSLDKNTDINPSDYDAVIVGGSIHMGQVQQVVKDFCQKHHDILLQKHLGLFICCMNEEKAMEEFNMAFPEELREHAAATGIMGGELLLDKMNFLDKLIVKTVAGQKSSVSKLDFAAADKFVEELSLKGESSKVEGESSKVEGQRSKVKGEGVQSMK